MSRRLIWILSTLTTLVIASAAIGYGYLWFKATFPEFAYRCRYNIAFEVDGEIFAGSSVAEVIWEGGPALVGSGRGYSPVLRGQAVLIDMGKKGAVVATLRPFRDVVDEQMGPYSFIELCGRAFGNRSRNPEIPELVKLRGRRELTDDNMPQFLYFSDLLRPNDFVVVSHRSLGVTMNAKARLVHAYVEVTSEPLVIDLDKKLSWYADLRKITMIYGRPGELKLSYHLFVAE